MRKKKKKTGYSLTAKERRDNRIKAVPNRELTDEEKAEIEAKQQKSRARRGLIIRVTAIVLVLAIAFSVLGYGIAQLILRNQIDNAKVNPIATIQLSNGKSIEMQLLYIENTPKANADGEITYGTSTDGRGPVANFIYLALNGFYDGTILSNSGKEGHGGFIAFEGYTAPGVHRAKDESYVAKLKGFTDDRPNKWDMTDYKLGYRIKRTTIVTPSVNNKVGYVAMIAANSTTFGNSTGFVMVTDNPQFTATVKDSTSIVNHNFETALSYMARVTDAESLAVMQAITQMETTANPIITNWAYPADLKIESIKITNLNSALKKNILENFEEFVLNDKSEMEGAMKSAPNWVKKANQYL